jgi:hypothetical protein
MPVFDPNTAPEGTALFFGCIRGPGHFLYQQENLPSVEGFNAFTRLFGKNLDGDFAPPSSQDQGAASLTHTNGWTILGWHDYTGDSRGGSNSNLLIKGTYSFEQMRAILMQRFPTVYNRQTKQIAVRTLG